MQLEDYFDFLSPDDIRIKGHRIGVESVLYEYIFRARTPEEIADLFPSLSLEQILATLLYYQRNKVQVDAYLAAWIEHGERMRAPRAGAQSDSNYAPAAAAQSRTGSCQAHPP